MNLNNLTAEKSIEIESANELTEDCIKEEIIRKYPNYENQIQGILSTLLIGEKELLESKIGESDKTAFEDLIESIKDAMPTEKKTMRMKTLRWIGFGIVTATTVWFCKDLFKQ